LFMVFILEYGHYVHYEVVINIRYVPEVLLSYGWLY